MPYIIRFDKQCFICPVPEHHAVGWFGESLELSISLIERDAFVSVSNKARWWNKRRVLIDAWVYPHILVPKPGKRRGIDEFTEQYLSEGRTLRLRYGSGRRNRKGGNISRAQDAAAKCHTLGEASKTAKCLAFETSQLTYLSVWNLVKTDYSR
jgi:hypothetical protein